MNIFALNENWLRLDSLLDESGGEVTPEIEAFRAEIINESKDSLEQAGLYRTWIKSQVKACKERQSAISETIAKLETRIERVDDILVRVLSEIGKPQRFPEFTLSTTTRENVAFTMKPGHEAWELDAGFTRPKVELNLDALKEALKEGNLPDEVAVMVTKSTSVMQRKPTTKKTESTENPATAA